MAPPAELIDDVTAEILLRLPPDEPEHLFRAALVCKPWLRVLCDPEFRRRYRAFHGAPPLLGLIPRRQAFDGYPAPRFASTTSMPDFPFPGVFDGHRARPLDCRHGRVLVQVWHERRRRLEYLVWDPITGDRHDLPTPDFDWVIYIAAVFCASDGCDHLDCHGGPFRVAFVAMATDLRKDIVKASAYSSETGAWSAPVSLGDYAQHMRNALYEKLCYQPFAQGRRGPVIRDQVYFALRGGNEIIKYNLHGNCLSVINPPPHNAYEIALMVMEDSSLGFAHIEYCSLYLWSTKVDSQGVAEWVQRRVIKVETLEPTVYPSQGPFVVGSAEGLGVIFISACAGLFTLDLKSEQMRKVDEPGDYFNVLPYMSFYTPDRGRLLSLARADDL
ncbi:unnamed protein product [Urochloa decumbens]|uniref:F-box domain-containing protein n=1 Tax=Urochloa decumbens TaxID=240449 RepID=A0ABC9EBZ9_9POAL